MKTKEEIIIIIPTLNNIQGLRYLTSYFKEKQYEIMVVDNKKKNLGFAGGVNKGVMDVKKKWMLILNDDIKFLTDPIETLIQFAEEKKLDAVSPILRNPDGEVENFGYRVLPYGKIELVKDQKSNANIDGLTAACLLIKTEIFKKLGGFDEKFFAYLEDVDFFLRLSALAQDRSFGLAYDIEVLHNHMTTTKTMGNFKARQDMVNWWRLFLKHPSKFKFNIRFLVERLKNISGYIKASL